MKARSLLFITCMIFFSSCEEGSEAFRDSLGIFRPKCKIISIQKIDKKPGEFARLVITVENDADGATAYDVGGKIRLKRDNVIIERDLLVMGILKRGEAIREEAWFSAIETHNEYDKCEITLFWTDIEGRYYEREYSR